MITHSAAQNVRLSEPKTKKNMSGNKVGWPMSVVSRTTVVWRLATGFK